jgi:hypothetical protein
MDPLDTYRTTALEILRFGQLAGVDLEPMREDFVFQHGLRWINFWRKNPMPGTGPEGEPLGTLHYAMQGPYAVAQSRPGQGSDSPPVSFHESGTLDSVEQAFRLAKAWVFENKDVEQLPPRHIRRTDMG